MEQSTARKTPGWVLDQEKQLFKKLEQERCDLFLYYDILLPVLKLQLEVEEYAREEFNFVHKTIIQLIHSDINSTDGLAHFMGLAESAITEKLNELIGLGFIEPSTTNKWVLTELGRNNVNSENPVRHVSRSLRLCASSEQLLPRNAYHSKFFRTDELTEKSLSWVVLTEETPEVDLAHVKSIELMTGTDKTFFNIPDEVQRVVSLHDYEPGFQKAKLLITGDRSDETTGNPSKAWVQFKNQFIEFPLTKTPKLVNQTGKRRDDTHSSIKRVLKQQGVDIGDAIQEDKYGVIYAKVLSASNKWLASKYESYFPNLIRCRTRTYNGRPFYKMFDSNIDILRGRSLVLDISELSYEIIGAANALREFYLIVDTFFDTPYQERSTRSIQTYLQFKLSASEREYYIELANKFSLSEVPEWFNGSERSNKFE